MARRRGSKDKRKRKPRRRVISAKSNKKKSSKGTYKKYFFASKDNPSKVRNTSILARTVKEAKSKLRRPSPANALVHSIEKMTPSEIKTAQSGRWVLTRPGGLSKRKSKKTRGYGPRPK